MTRSIKSLLSDKHPYCEYISTFFICVFTILFGYNGGMINLQEPYGIVFFIICVVILTVSFYMAGMESILMLRKQESLSKCEREHSLYDYLRVRLVWSMIAVPDTIEKECVITALNLRLLTYDSNINHSAIIPYKNKDGVEVVDQLIGCWIKEFTEMTPDANVYANWEVQQSCLSLLLTNVYLDQLN